MTCDMELYEARDMAENQSSSLLASHNCACWYGMDSFPNIHILPSQDRIIHFLLYTILPSLHIIIIIIIIERKDLGGVMSIDCKDTLQMLKTVTKRECDAKWEQSICQMWS